MPNAVPDGGDPMFAEHPAAAPGEEELDCPRVPQHRAAGPFLLPHDLAGLVARHEPRQSKQPLDLTAQERLGRLAVEENREL